MNNVSLAAVRKLTDEDKIIWLPYGNGNYVCSLGDPADVPTGVTYFTELNSVKLWSFPKDIQESYIFEDESNLFLCICESRRRNNQDARWHRLGHAMEFTSTTPIVEYTKQNVLRWKKKGGMYVAKLDNTTFKYRENSNIVHIYMERGYFAVQDTFDFKINYAILCQLCFYDKDSTPSIQLEMSDSEQPKRKFRKIYVRKRQ